jgi:choline-sulfatase
MANNQPNILFIMTDQHIAGVSGFGGDPFVNTPNLDKLASRSIQFDTAACASPLCTTSRMCMLTGKEVHHCAAWSNHWVIFPEHTTWPGHFAEHGYTTCLVGKMHFGGKDQLNGFKHRPYGDLRHGLGHQPDPISMFPGYAGARSAGHTEIPESLLQDVVVTREALSFLREHQDAQPRKPWFICASYSRPHPPFTAPGRYIHRYRDKIPPADIPDGHADGMAPYAASYLDRFSDLTPEESVRGREAYYACVDFVDDCIGELLNGLENDGLLENTVIIYTSDHGEMLGQHGLWGKTVYYEPAVAVPLLITGPGVKTGHAHVTHPVSLMDLFPTTAVLAGLPIPKGLDGVDLSPVLAEPDTAASPRDYAPCSFYKYGGLVNLEKNPNREDQPHGAWRSGRDERYKYVEIEGGTPLLFDLREDPNEHENLAGHTDHQARCRAMHAALYRDFSWEAAHAQLAADRERLPAFKSGLRPSTPNQYRLPDGRIFDAEGALYGARWLALPDETSGGIIPQQFG